MKLKTNPIKIKRIYETPLPEDGFRILTDRLWPRGVTKERAALSYWHKDIAPSPDLRKRFAHKSENFVEFSELYTEELKHKVEMIDEVKKLAQQKPVTLLYAARDPKINHAVVLQKFILNN